MKQFFILLVLLCSLASCRKQTKLQELKDGFVIEMGKYDIGGNDFEVFEFTDGTFAFSMQDKNKKLLIDGNRVGSFSKYHGKVIYFDDDLNLWYYNVDIQLGGVLMRQPDGSYISYNFCEEDFPLPPKFLKVLDKPLDKLCIHSLKK